jgi:hypothetical protein
MSAMPIAHHQTVADGVLCIETGLYRDGLAACYLIRERDRLAFVDTGTAHTVPRLLGVIDALGLTPAHVDYVIPTHVHLDHAGGAGALMAACPNATLIAHPKAAPHLIDPAKLTAGATAVYGEAAFARDFGELLAVPSDRVVAAQDGQASTWRAGGSPSSTRRGTPTIMAVSSTRHPGGCSPGTPSASPTGRSIRTPAPGCSPPPRRWPSTRTPGSGAWIACWRWSPPQHF